MGKASFKNNDFEIVNSFETEMTPGTITKVLRVKIGESEIELNANLFDYSETNENDSI